MNLFGQQALFRKLAGFYPLGSAEYVDGTELLSDWDCEAADASAWSAYYASLSKVAGARTGGSGAKILRANSSGAASGWFGASQNKLTLGRRYNLDGWLRWDGGAGSPDAILAIGHASGISGYFDTGNLSGDGTWRHPQVQFNCLTSGVIYFVGGRSGSTVWPVDRYIDIDEMSVKERKSKCYADSGMTANHAEQYYAAYGADHYGRSNAANDFNGSTAYLKYTADVIKNYNVTVCGWVYLDTFGGSVTGHFVDNSKFRIYFLRESTSPDRGRIIVTSDYVTDANSTSNVIYTATWYFVAVTRTSAGVTNMYLGTTSSAPALTGAANQSSGTPSATPTNTWIGMKNDNSRWFDGRIERLSIHQRILPLHEIKHVWAGGIMP